MAASTCFNSLRQQGSTSLSLPAGSYVYSLCQSGGDALAAISSDNSLRRFDRQTLKLLPDGLIADTHTGKDSGVTCLCAADGRTAAAGQLLATAGRDGTVKLWDCRTGNQNAASIYSTGSDKVLPALLSLACDPESHSIAAGSELVSAQSSLSFWDLRYPGPPRMQYVESHNDDITELCYHFTRSNVLLSGSTDGLVNIYDTMVTDEDEALLQVINHGSVHHAGFIGEKAVYALSHDEVFSIHPLNDLDENILEPAPILFGDLRTVLQCDYVVNVLVDAESAYTAIGSTREQTLDMVPIVASPKFHFDRAKAWRLPGAHGDEVVRSVLVDSLTKTIYTGGEDGHVRVWKEESADDMQEDVKPMAASEAHIDQPPKHKEKRKEKRHKDKRYKPY